MDPRAVRSITVSRRGAAAQFAGTFATTLG